MGWLKLIINSQVLSKLINRGKINIADSDILNYKTNNYYEKTKLFKFLDFIGIFFLFYKPFVNTWP